MGWVIKVWWLEGKEIVKPEILKYTTYLEYVCNYAWWSHAQAALGEQENATSLRNISLASIVGASTSTII